MAEKPLYDAYPSRTKALTEADLETAREQFKAVIDSDSTIRRRMKSDHEYIDGATEDAQGNPIGKMWTETERKAQGNRPALEVDMLSGPIAQVSNGLAEAKPAADMVPIGGGADPEKAEVWEGMLRRIQTTPEAEYAAAYAADHLTKIGRGVWGVKPKFPEFNGKIDDPANWDMELVRFWIENQHAAFLGPATEPDGSDRMFAFILQPFTKDLFNARFAEGDTDEWTEQREAFDALDPVTKQGLGGWKGDKTLTVGSWYRVKHKSVEISGKTADGKVRTRKVKERYVCHSIITATKEYEYEELPIPYIPIVMGEAKRTNIDGEKDVRGMVRRGRQPQDMVNAWNSHIAETIAKAARQEVIAAAGQISGGFEAFWDMTKRLPWREYNPVTVDGKLSPPPSIESHEPPIQALTIALQQAESNVLKATLHYDASSDETNASRSKESGVARKQRQQQGELGSSDYMRAYGFMIQYEIKLLMAWIPKVYEAARVMRITGRDEQPFTAITHFGESFAGDAQAKFQELGGQMGPDGKPAPMDDPHTGVKGIYDMSTGRYDMKAKLTKNPLTQRQENVDFLTELAPALPPEMQAAIVPIMLEESDGTVAKKVAAALKPKDKGSISVEQAQQAQQMIDLLTTKVEELQREKDAKTDQTQSSERIALAEIDSKETIERAKLEMKREEMLHEEKMKEYELDVLKHQMEFDAQQASLSSGRELIGSEMQRDHEREQTASQLAHQTAERQESEDFEAVQGQAGHLNALEMQAEKPQPGAGA